MKGFKRIVKKSINAMGYTLLRNDLIGMDHLIDLNKHDQELIKEIYSKKYSMASIPRLVATAKACRYVVNSDIEGDFIECGVWRGGNSILAKKIFEDAGSDKQVILCDTFLGMSEPTDKDVKVVSRTSAYDKFLKNDMGEYNSWCYASLDEVRSNFVDFDCEMSGVTFVKGKVEDTLPKMPSDSIYSILRLDTDWYESTRSEIEWLYPKLSAKGVLILDDYGHWDGARKAIDEYFQVPNEKLMFNVTDYTGRVIIKTE